MGISQKLSGSILYGAGLAIGVVMLLLSVTGLIDALARAVPKTVVRGIQFGLGLQLATLALKDYLLAEWPPGTGGRELEGRFGVIMVIERNEPPASNRRSTPAVPDPFRRSAV